MAQLFEVDVRTVNEHLKNIFKAGELEGNSTIRNFRIVQTEGSRQVSRNVAVEEIEKFISSIELAFSGDVSSVIDQLNNIKSDKLRRWFVAAHYSPGKTDCPGGVYRCN